MFSLRSLFRSSKQKYAETRFPPNWPSYLHSKCNMPLCAFPNPPQAAAGMYNCQGTIGRRCCEGTYEVTSSMAHSMVKRHNFDSAPGINTKANKKAPARPPRPEESLDAKALPPIPGLSQRNVQSYRSAYRPVPAPAPMPPPRPTVVLHYPLYPSAVQPHYAPVAASSKHYAHPPAHARRYPTNHH